MGARRVRAGGVLADAGSFPSIAIKSPSDVYDLLADKVRGAEQEQAWSIGLDSRHRVVSVELVALGSAASVTVHARDVFRELIRKNCCAFIFAHNHPSGMSDPSPDDDDLTERLRSAADLLGIPLLDHVILVASGKNYSYTDRGRL